jgi:hypothetical protein
MSKFQVAGLLIIFLGIAMFLFGVSMFTYQGNSLTHFMSNIGKYSFEFWLPTIVVGSILLFIKKAK